MPLAVRFNAWPSKCDETTRDSRSVIATPVLSPLMFPALLQHCLRNMFRSRFNRKNTFCSYRHNSPCVGLRYAVETNELLVYLWASPTHRMPAQPYYGMDRNCIKIESSGCIQMYGDSELSSPVQKDISKKIPSHLLFRPNPATKKIKVFFNCRLDYWSGHGRTNRTVCYGPASVPFVQVFYSASLQLPKGPFKCYVKRMWVGVSTFRKKALRRCTIHRY